MNVIEPPPHLDEVAAGCWRSLAPQLAAMGTLESIDQNSLATYCTTYSRWRAAEAFIDKYGDIYATRHPNGTLRSWRAYPAVRIAHECSNQLLRMAREFGMTPLSRSAVRPPAPSPSRELVEFIRS